MINFDVIGRVENDRLSITGGESGEGMSEWLDPLFDASGLEIVKQDGMRGGGGDHASFYHGIPVLFAICADYDDYHTPDGGGLIHRRAGVKTVELFHDIALEARHPRRTSSSSRRPRRPAAVRGRRDPGPSV